MLRILRYLSEPANSERGASEHDILTDAAHTSVSTGRRLLAEMLADGFIERGEPNRHNRNIKPYFVTQSGKDYLSIAIEQALFPELADTPDWTARQNADRTRASEQAAEDDVKAILRGLPEFQSASTQRVQEVSRLIVSNLSGTLNRVDAPDR